MFLINGQKMLSAVADKGKKTKGKLEQYKGRENLIIASITVCTSPK
jgi:hypothetical protein